MTGAKVTILIKKKASICQESHVAFLKGLPSETWLLHPLEACPLASKSLGEGVLFVSVALEMQWFSTQILYILFEIKVILIECYLVGFFFL